MESLDAFRSLDTGNDEQPGRALSRALGWFSLGLGAVELVAPNKMTNAIGLEPGTRRSVTVRAQGVRELIAGAGILLRPRRAPVWARVAGDVLDLALLAWASRGERTSNGRLIAATVAALGCTVLDVYATRQVANAQPAQRPVMATVTINKPPQEVYAYYRRLEQLPKFMDYLESVEQLDRARSKWTAKLPIAGQVSWESEIVEDRPGEKLAWKTVDGEKLVHRGQVTFARAPGRDATEVRVELELGMPGIPPNATLARLLSGSQIKGDLRRLKQVLETGEVLVSDASAHRLPHPAQPSKEEVKS